MRAHDATNEKRGVTDFPVDLLARELFEQQASGAVTWDDLPTAERAAWLARSEQSLQALACLGYRLEPDASTAAAPTRPNDARTAAHEAERFLGYGEPLLAYNTLQNALADFPADLRLRQLKGLALARSGALQRAQDTLMELRKEGHADAETFGILARTHKDLALASADEIARKRHLAAAFDIYATAYRESRRRGSLEDAYYTGINAATMAFLRGNAAVAHEIAAEVEAICKSAIKDKGDDAGTYWVRATLAEAALILGDEELARERYADAAASAGLRFGNLSSTKHQARILLQYLGASTRWLDEALSVPPVLVYTGHMIDAPARALPRFAASMESEVSRQIREVVKRANPVAVYGSAACGADILCLESALDIGAELHIVLPFSVEAFRNTSVDLGNGGCWGDRFDRLLDKANEVLVISEHPPDGDASAYEYTNLMITGLGRLRAQMLETGLQGVAVWDGIANGDAGGTASVVNLWRQADVPFEHVPVSANDRGSAGTVPQPVTCGARPVRGWPYTYSIEAMLFADATGFSRLTEEQIPLFFEHYNGAIAELNDTTDHKAVHIETAGDGMYLVFDDTRAAANYALELSELMSGRDWQAYGLPGDLGIRVGLHCGPVFIGRDPITNLPLYSGTHTSRTARIEPITPPGQVYASSAFAAVTAARKVGGLRFSYIGRTRLAKHYGVLPLYHVKRDFRVGQQSAEPARESVL